MTRIIAARTVQDNYGQTADAFIVPDMTKLMMAHVKHGDEVVIPISIRDGQASFWESGGRRNKGITSIGIVITGNNDSLLDAILFNKLAKVPNGKQALIMISPGYRVYAAKISIGVNTLDPKMKIIRLIYKGMDKTTSDDNTTYGTFSVDTLFTSYEEIKGCVPAERLLMKMFVTNAMRPYFANGWSVSNISKHINKDRIKDAYTNLMSITTPVEKHTNADQFLDAVEDAVIKMNNPRLSAVFQTIDFETGVMTMKPLKSMLLSDILGTAHNTTAAITFEIPINAMNECYNRRIMFNSTDIPMLEMALKFDDKYAVYTKSRTFCCIRGYRG